MVVIFVYDQTDLYVLVYYFIIAYV